MSRILYKYLDIDGALAMLEKRTIRFTNATQMNDPFDCHPSLIDFSNASEGAVTEEWGQLMVETEVNRAKNLRMDTWLCCLSKNFNSILMWSHYGRNHTGVCVGFNVDRVLKSVPPLFGTYYLEPFLMEVNYKDILERPKVCCKSQSLWEYQLTTKAKDWEYEQEVRLVMDKPTRQYCTYTKEVFDKMKERRRFIHDSEIPRDMPLKDDLCFDCIYLGANISAKNKDKIIKYARSLNPIIRIHQMQVDEFAFRLKTKEINPPHPRLF